MRGIEPEEYGLSIHFDKGEPGLLASLVEQVVELLDPDDLARRQHAARSAAKDSGEDPFPQDPFARWEADFSAEVGGSVDDPNAGLDLDDPVVRRIFPDAYPDDPAASHDFRRFTQTQQRDQKVTDAQVVLADLAVTGRKGVCHVEAESVTAWLKTLTAVRLALAARLGIVDETSASEVAELPEDDPRSWVYELYQWTAWVQECLLGTL